jgi:hypothetical protein
MRHSERVLLADGRVVPAVAWAAWVLLDAAGVTLSWDAARGVRMRPALPADDPLLRAVAPHREVLRQVVQALAEDGASAAWPMETRPAVGSVPALLAVLARSA